MGANRAMQRLKMTEILMAARTALDGAASPTTAIPISSSISISISISRQRCQSSLEIAQRISTHYHDTVTATTPASPGTRSARKQCKKQFRRLEHLLAVDMQTRWHQIDCLIAGRKQPVLEGDEMEAVRVMGYAAPAAPLTLDLPLPLALPLAVASDANTNTQGRSWGREIRKHTRSMAGIVADFENVQERTGSWE